MSSHNLFWRDCFSLLMLHLVTLGIDHENKLHQKKKKKKALQDPCVSYGVGVQRNFVGLDPLHNMRRGKRKEGSSFAFSVAILPACSHLCQHPRHVHWVYVQSALTSMFYQWSYFKWSSLCPWKLQPPSQNTFRPRLREAWGNVGGSLALPQSLSIVIARETQWNDLGRWNGSSASQKWLQKSVIGFQDTNI